MPLVLDVTVRLIQYTDTGKSVLPYVEERGFVQVEHLSENLSTTEDGQSFCRSVLQDCLNSQSLCNKD